MISHPPVSVGTKMPAGWNRQPATSSVSGLSQRALNHGRGATAPPTQVHKDTGPEPNRCRCERHQHKNRNTLVRNKSRQQVTPDRSQTSARARSTNANADMTPAANTDRAGSTSISDKSKTRGRAFLLPREAQQPVKGNRGCNMQRRPGRDHP